MRSKSRQSMDVCGDCGAQDPSWASVNKGILLCIECCSIHRSLGRHISQVKSFQKSDWSNVQLNMVHALNASGANSIWEHSLDGGGSKVAKRKPTPKDPLHIKADFIHAKHQQNAFAAKPNQEDGLRCVENELGKELHGSVRTCNLETSLRLLVQGADPNYFHDEKGTTPLHVAVKANRVYQAELLMVYGADPTYPDAHGHTPIDYAKQHHVNNELLNRMVEHQYSVTDAFAHYLSPQKLIDHERGIHFKIPTITFRQSNMQTALYKLKKLPNYLFEQLAMDVYDEVDRREIEAIWLGSAETVELNANAVPFLPVNPSLSATRNQGRQKLARFSTPELKTLVLDILVDIQRRQVNAEKAWLLNRRRTDGGGGDCKGDSQISDDDEPLYDSVASDEDYVCSSNCDKKSVEETGRGDGPAANNNDDDDDDPNLEVLTRKLQASDDTICHLQTEVDALKDLVKHLHSENYELKTRLSLTENCSRKAATAVITNGDGNAEAGSSGRSRDENSCVRKRSEGQDDAERADEGTGLHEIDYRHTKRCRSRPFSMYETREGLKTPNWQALKNQMKLNEHSSNVTTSLYCGGSDVPKNRTIMQCMERVTKEIQQLWKGIHGSGRDDCLRCANRIKTAVSNLTAVVSSEQRSTDIVKRLSESASRLEGDCANLQQAHKAGNQLQIEQFLQQVGYSAYEIAKGTKLIVTTYSLLP